MTYHSPPVMVAIGLLGDEAEAHQLATSRWNCHANRHRSSHPIQAKLRQGNAGVLVGDPVRENPLKSTIIVGSERVAADLADRGDTRGRSRLVGHSEGRPRDGRRRAFATTWSSRRIWLTLT